MAGLVLVDILSSLEYVMVLTALPAIVRDFGDIASASWVMTAFLLAQAVSAAVGGRLGDMFGRRRVLVLVVAAAAIGSLVSAFAPSPQLVVLGRAIQGVSGAILPLCFGITRQIAPANSSAFWISVLTGSYMISALVGYVLGGYLADVGHWRWIFHVTALYSCIAIIPLLTLVPEPAQDRRSQRFDYLGAILFAPAVAALLYAITASRKLGWSNMSTGGLLVASIAALGLWFAHEWRCKDPLIDVKLLRRRPIWLGNACGAIMSLGLAQLPVLTLLLLQQPRLAGFGFAVSGAVAGLMKLPSNLSAAVGAPLSGWIAGRSGARWATLIGALAGSAAWTSLYHFHDTILQVVAATVLAGFANAMLLASIPNLVLEGAPAERTSEVTGLSSVVRAVCAAIGAQLMAVLLARSERLDPASGARFPSEAAYELVFLSIALSAALVVVICVAPPLGQTRRLRQNDTSVAG